MGNSKEPWTKVDDARLMVLRDEGLSATAISQQMHRRPETIRKKLAMLGLCAEGSVTSPQVIGPELFDDENDWRKLLRPEVVQELGRRAWRGDV